MPKLAVFYHCLIYRDSDPSPIKNAAYVVMDQVEQMRTSGLLAEADEFVVGINGGEESIQAAKILIPEAITVVGHGLQCKTENRTLVLLEKWVPTHTGWYVLYLHSKGATHATLDDIAARWRGCMMRNLVRNWRTCVADLDAGHEAVGCHWMTGKQTPPGQSIFAGNFWWAKTGYLQTIMPLAKRARILQSGLDALASRYEAEVWIGNAPRLPKVKDYHGPNWNPGMVGTCVP